MSPEARLRVLNAGNRGAFTLDGTRSYVVGAGDLVIIDPGPDLEEHVRGLVRLASSAPRVTIALTHGHADHVGATTELVGQLQERGAEVEVVGSGHPLARTLSEGETFSVGGDAFVALGTPGHTEDHLAFHWVEGRALFPGDLLLGEGDTTWVAGYPGCVRDYLESLVRLRSIEVDVIYAAHGPPILDPESTIDRFRSHRLRRIAQVRRGLELEADATASQLVSVVYGDRVPPELERAAEESIVAMIQHLQDPRSG